jgi:hypothetical protein
MDGTPGAHTSQMTVQCHRCARWFLWRYGKPITPAAMLHRPLYCPACRKLVAQHHIAL